MELTEQALFVRIWHSCFPSSSSSSPEKVDSAIDASLGDRRLHFLPAYKTKLNKDFICSSVHFIFFFSCLAFSVGITQTGTTIKMKPHQQIMSCRQTMQVMARIMLKIHFLLTDLFLHPKQ